jgi:hypothetical protein
MGSPRPPVQKTQTFQIPLLRKSWTKYVALFVWHDLSRERDYKPHLKFYMKKSVLCIYRMIPTMLGFNERVTNFGVTTVESVAVSGLNVAFREVYNTDILQFWYHTIGIHLILLHVEFEDGFSISVLKIKALRLNNLQLEIVKFLKKSNVHRPPAHFSNPAFSNCRVRGS